jgi:hypothetical protein
LGKLPQYRITGRMTPGIVYPLEVIDVEYQADQS